jgi:hypothetical protein
VRQHRLQAVLFESARLPGARRIHGFSKIKIKSIDYKELCNKAIRNYNPRHALLTTKRAGQLPISLNVKSKSIEAGF